MLPFFKPRKMGAVIVAEAKKDGGIEALHEEGQLDPRLHSAMDDFLSSYSQKDSEGMAKAMHSFHSICNSSGDPGDE